MVFNWTPLQWTQFGVEMNKLMMSVAFAKRTPHHSTAAAVPNFKTAFLLQMPFQGQLFFFFSSFLFLTETLTQGKPSSATFDKCDSCVVNGHLHYFTLQSSDSGFLQRHAHEILLQDFGSITFSSGQKRKHLHSGKYWQFSTLRYKI